jgi:molecular chaperone GrpE
MSENDENKKGFRVVDRRFSKLDESEIGDGSQETEQKPEYVAQLERALADKESRLQKIAASHENSVSDFQGARDRIKGEALKDVERGRRSLIVDFLDIIDNLDRAIEATGQTGDLNTLLDGVKMVRDMFLGKLEALGIQRVDAMGHHFDPAMHKAVTVVPADDPSNDGQIVGVIQEGYLMGEDIIRPASVAVARTDS